MEQKEMYKLGIEHRITKLESGVSDIGKNVDKIMNNHLVHVQASMDKIEQKIMYGLWFVIITLVGILVDLITRIVPTVLH